MDTLQKALNQASAQMPALFLENLISKRLKAEGVVSPKGLALEIAQHLLTGSTEPFISKNVAKSRNINLSLTAADLDEVAKAIDAFSENQLPALLPLMAGKLSRSILKDLKTRWPDEQAQQEVDFSGFRARLEQRWGKSLGPLRMLLTMVREWCERAHHRESGLRQHTKKQFRQVLIRLLVRGCQVTDEVICLLENGFADGAMARWRTLHETAVVAAIISQGGENAAERYVEHQAVESKRAMTKRLGSKPGTSAAVNVIEIRTF